MTEAGRAELDQVQVRGHAAETPGWVKTIGEARPAFREQLSGRQSMRIPDPDPEYADYGPAWPMIAPRERDAIMQRPEPQMPPAPGTAPESQPEA